MDERMYETVDKILGDLDEISLCLQAMMTAEQREWFNEHNAEREAELRAIGFQGNGE